MGEFTENLRENGRVELVCEHGVGHTVYDPNGPSMHGGCDGCCGGLEYATAAAAWWDRHHRENSDKANRARREETP